jgi:hypothetical protein
MAQLSIGKGPPRRMNVDTAMDIGCWNDTITICVSVPLIAATHGLKSKQNSKNKSSFSSLLCGPWIDIYHSSGYSRTTPPWYPAYRERRDGGRGTTVITVLLINCLELEGKI